MNQPLADRVCHLAFMGLLLGLQGAAQAEDGYVPLFPEDGPPKGWRVRAWNDLSQEPGPGTEWTVHEGILRVGQARGTWLVSEREYGDFVLEFEILLTERGNSGVALRAPWKGDPAFEALEMQVADLRYNTQAAPAELTGAIYRAVAPTVQAYRPTEWNAFKIDLRGTQLKIVLNDQVIQDIDLATLDRPTRRHDGSEAPPVKDRPRRGHIGFQHLSRDNEPIQIRNARICPLD